MRKLILFLTLISFAATTTQASCVESYEKKLHVMYPDNTLGQLSRAGAWFAVATAGVIGLSPVTFVFTGGAAVIYGLHHERVQNLALVLKAANEGLVIVEGNKAYKKIFKKVNQLSSTPVTHEDIQRAIVAADSEQAFCKRQKDLVTRIKNFSQIIVNYHQN